jgi:outer membrane autotransporter protein
MFLLHSFRFVGTLLMSLLPAAAIAQMEPKGFYVTGYAQYSRIGSSTFTESGALGAGSGLNAEFKGGGGLGGDIGYRYGNGWAAEVEWNYRRHSLSSLRQGGATLAQDGDFASSIILINGLRRFKSSPKWTPYVGAGIGWVQEIDVDIKPLAGGGERGYSKNNKAAFQLIAGAEYALTQNWRLTADARWLRVGSVTMNNESGNTGGSVTSLDYNPVSFQIGVRYSF